MGPELDVLVPFNLLASTGPFEVELRMVQPEIWTKQVFGYIDDRPVKAEFGEVRIKSSGLRNSAQAGIVWTVSRSQKDGRGRLRQCARLVDKPLHCYFQSVEPCEGDEAGQDEIAACRIGPFLQGRERFHLCFSCH